MKKYFKTAFICALAAFIAIGGYSPAQAGYDHEFLNPNNATATVLGTGTDSLKCRVLADDVTNGRPIYVDCADFAKLGGSTFTGAVTMQSTLGVTGVLTATGGVNGIVGGVTPAAGTFTTLTSTSSSPTAIIGPPPTAGGASIVLTAAKAGQVTKLDTAAGTTVTLPAATGTGNHYLFVVSVAASSNAHKILAASSSDNIIGIMYGQNANTAKVFQCTAASTYHSIQMPFAGTQPSGGQQGDSFEFIDIGTNLWWVRGNYSAGTTPTTPCSTSTS